jgi:hypothetical protein
MKDADNSVLTCKALTPLGRSTPVAVGHGKPFSREGQAVNLKLAATKSFSKIVKLTYEALY